MSTTFKRVIGKWEDYSKCGWDTSPLKPEYKDVEVSLASFYGGIERGRCIGLVLTGCYYAQLTKESVIELRNALNDWLDERELKDIRLEEEN